MLKTSTIYVDHLWYPILVNCGGYNKIVEMQGKEINRWNYQAWQASRTVGVPTGWRI